MSSAENFTESAKRQLKVFERHILRSVHKYLSTFTVRTKSVEVVANLRIHVLVPTDRVWNLALDLLSPNTR